MTDKQHFLDILNDELSKNSFVKLTLSKRRQKGSEWENVFARIIEIKGEKKLSCTLRYKTRDETKNYPLPLAATQISDWLAQDFYNADLFSENTHWSFQSNKKGKEHLRSQALQSKRKANQNHDHKKQRPIEEGKTRPYLTALGIANASGKILQQGQKKFRQINKYIELISHLLKESPLPKGARIVDMGSGKGYLTFALYDYLVNELGMDIKMTGIELRPNLVNQCNLIANVNDFEQLEFIAQDMH